MNRDPKFEELLEKYLSNRCTPEEAEQILQWLSAETTPAEQKSVIGKVLETAGQDLTAGPEHYDERLVKVFERISGKIADQHINRKRRARYRLRYLSAAAAAAIIITLGAYLVMQYNKGGSNAALSAAAPQVKDFKPGGNKAVLTLGDGSEVLLEEAQNGDLATQGSATVTKKDGQLIYSKNAISSPVLYNVITTPRGGQYQLTLEDGSRVWLNAASSIRFPASFQGDERKIEITGEAYFEIAKDPNRPFKVAFETPSGSKSEVTVLGTHFNIMCYKDEKAAKTTLVEGSVSIYSDGNTALLKPAQQAAIKAGEAIRVLSNVNVDEVIAWKEGYFEFNDTGLQEVMRQLGRWYDVDIRYEGKAPDRRFGGKISRESNASEVLKILELSQVKFRIENKKIIVMP